MPNVTRTHPTAMTVEFENQGANLMFFTVDYVADVSAAARAAPDGILDKVFQLIQQNATIVVAGPLFDTGSQQTFAVEAVGGNFPTSTWDGVNSETWVADLEDRIQALGAGTYDTITSSSITVTATKLGVATLAAIS